MYMIESTNNMVDKLYYSNCQSTTVENCSEYSAFDKCSVCDENYYLNSDYTCTKYPTQQIEGCESYASDTKCAACETGKCFLNGLCKEQTHIENCAEYDQDTNCRLCA